MQCESNVCVKFGYEKSVLDINLEWVIQGYNIGFQGFFVELLGFSGSLSTLLPQARLVKSSFKKSFDESLFTNEHDFLNKELFVEEMSTVLTIASATQIKNITKPPNANKFGTRDSFCYNAQTFEENYVYVGAELAKGLMFDVLDSTSCCEKCFLNPLCLAWSFDSSVCSMKASMVQNGYLKQGAVSGRMISRQKSPEVEGTTTAQVQHRRPAPSVVVYHGTTCIHLNESASAHNRDINTILIGRYMLERPYLVGGYNLDEYAVLHCAARMDEVWVPTEWHKTVFLRLLTQQGSAASVPLISIIPEAVDTTLFDPDFVRTGASRSIVSADRLLLVDGSRIANTTTRSDAVVVHKLCGFVEERIKCEDNQKFEFLSVFKWEYRKGWDVMLDAFWAAFGPEDDVVLRIRSYVPLTSGGDRNISRLIAAHALKTHGAPLSELAKVVWENGVDGFTVSRFDPVEVEQAVDGLTVSAPPTRAGLVSEEGATTVFQEQNQHAVHETHLTREDMRDLLASANAFVLATRGEGWGLPVAEAMAMALPVIVTNHSGPAAFATVANAYLIPTLPDLDQLSFAKPDEVALANIMRQVVYESSDAGQFRAQQRGRAARETMKEISPDSIVCKMNDRIRYHAGMRGWNFP